jgi:hypothetical protein
MSLVYRGRPICRLDRPVAIKVDDARSYVLRPAYLLMPCVVAQARRRRRRLGQSGWSSAVYDQGRDGDLASSW